LVIDGTKTAVEEYSERLKGLRWKAIQQRHFEVYEVPAPSCRCCSPSTTQIVTGSSSFKQDQEEEEVERYRRIRKNLPASSSNGVHDQDHGVFEVHSMAQLLLLARASGFDDQLLQILKIK
jgi:hypothetical protein